MKTLLKLHKKILLVSIAFFMLTMGVLYYVSSKHEEADNLRLIDTQLELAAKTIPLLLGSDFYESTDNQDLIPVLQGLTSSNPIGRYARKTGLHAVQAILKRDNAYYLLASSSDDGKLYFYSPYTNMPKEYTEVFSTGRTRYYNHEDPTGTYRSICHLHYIKNGNPFLVVASISTAPFQLELMAIQKRSKLLAFSILLVIVSLSYLLYKSAMTLKKLHKELEKTQAQMRSLVQMQQIKIANATKELDKERNNLELFASLNEGSLSGVIILDGYENILEINKTAIEILNLDKKNYDNVSFSSIWGKDFIKKVMQKNSDAAKNNGIETTIGEYKIVRPEGTSITVLARIGIFHAQTPEALRLFISFHDISEVTHNQEKLDYLIHHDLSTNLLNRKGFLISMEHMRQERKGTSPSVLVFIVREFKRINEALGISAGDEVLCMIAQRLKENLLPGEALARLGDVDFAIASNVISDKNKGYLAAKRILNILTSPFIVEGSEFFLSGNVGIMLPMPGKTIEDHLTGATVAAMEAKKMDRDKVLFYHDHLQKRSIQAMELESHLRNAIHERAFTIYFQPIVNIQSGEIWGVEALARWFMPNGEAISPSSFIPLAESTGLIHSLSKTLFSLTGEGFMRLKREKHDLFLSLNVSTVLFKENAIEKLLPQCLEETGVPPKKVVLEITETALIADMENCKSTLERLVERGYTIAIDDFGVGNSSINYLQNFPIKKLKIDQSFVRNIGAPNTDWTLVRAILSMSRVLQIDVVAEGVETLRQKNLLKKLKCPYGQGYLYYKPTDVPTCITFLRRSQFRPDP